MGIMGYNIWDVTRCPEVVKWDELPFLFTGIHTVMQVMPVRPMTFRPFYPVRWSRFDSDETAYMVGSVTRPSVTICSTRWKVGTGNGRTM